MSYCTFKVIDFFTTSSIPTDNTIDENRPQLPSLTLPQTLQQEASALIVIADEEMVAIDLTDSSWKMMKLPYLVSLHASAITCSHYVSCVDEEIYKSIIEAGMYFEHNRVLKMWYMIILFYFIGEKQTEHLYSSAEWPVSGGSLLCSKPANPDEPSHKQLLLTGHEDGTVRFWDASGVTLVPIYKFATANLFRYFN